MDFSHWQKRKKKSIDRKQLAPQHSLVATVEKENLA